MRIINLRLHSYESPFFYLLFLLISSAISELHHIGVKVLAGDGALFQNPWFVYPYFLLLSYFFNIIHELADAGAKIAIVSCKLLQRRS